MLVEGRVYVFRNLELFSVRGVRVGEYLFEWLVGFVDDGKFILLCLSELIIKDFVLNVIEIELEDFVLIFI